ncbi:uncharacterized protein [Malus domestica]|uniref:uncharacterized protein n=1 Tax=Malus domestica TaxID=3750 RepID=UPI003974E9E7
MKSNLEDVVTAIDLSRKTMSRIRLNYVWALGYNVHRMPVAAEVLFPFTGIRLPPWLADENSTFGHLQLCPQNGQNSSASGTNYQISPPQTKTSLPLVAHFQVAIGALAISHTNFSTNQSALLALKAHITSDPLNILTANWSSASNSDICNWVGISCGAGHHRITALNLWHMGLARVFLPHLGKLSFLVELGLKIIAFMVPYCKNCLVCAG